MSNITKGGRNYSRNVKQNKKLSEPVDETNPIIASFRIYSRELDNKHDRYERVLKLSRDITIESKRIIFLLHTIDPKKGNVEKVLQEAEKRLQVLCSINFLAIAKELGDLDPYQYGRAYSPALQEFVEAHTFFEHLSKTKMSDWNDLQKKLEYEVVEENQKVDNKTDADNSEKNVQPTKYSCFIQPIEFISGLADIGGEIMRRCINSLGSGDVETCFESCKSLQELYAGYLGITTSRNRDLSRKIYTLKQSVLKTENVCYNVKVRGSEAAKWGLITDVYSEKHFDEDEGYF